MQSSADGRAFRKWRLGLGNLDSPGCVNVRRVNVRRRSFRHGRGHHWHGGRARYPLRHLGFDSDGAHRNTARPSTVKSVGRIHQVSAGNTPMGNRHRRDSTCRLRREVCSAVCQRIHERSVRDHNSCLGNRKSNRGRSNDRHSSARENSHGRCGDMRRDHARANIEPLLVEFEKWRRLRMRRS